VCQKAFLGTADLNVSIENANVLLQFGTYNPARVLQNDVFQSMVDMMKNGECPNRAHPLIVAVELGNIQLHSLTTKGDDDEPGTMLGAVEFVSTPVTLQVLAGMHRVAAAQEASAALRSRLKKLVALEGKSQPRNIEDEDGEDGVPDEETQQIAEMARKEGECTKRLIERLENWPVRFYDIGTSKYHSIPPPADGV
jgi:hypothetical protein